MNHPGYLIWEAVLRTRKRHASLEGALQQVVVRAGALLQAVLATPEELQGMDLARLEEYLHMHARLDQQNSIISAAFTFLKRKNQGLAKILQYYDDHV